MMLDRMAWFVVTLSTLVSALFIAWSLFVKVDFLYPLWHEVMELEQTIQTYAPKNRFRSGFEQTDSAEQQRLFSGIVASIHDQGRGLAELTYHDPQGQRLGQFLTEAEIIHLQDVARLVMWFHLLGWLSILLTMLLLFLLYKRCAERPTIREYLISGGALSLLLGLVVFAVGPKELFYWLHAVIFPDNHQWFFYYQESLMTTMMRAPDLFAYIAVEWILLTLLIQSMLLSAANAVVSRRFNFL
ncbi:MAG: DUF1461 domain-containing protein [Candidatus Polarisedimenticolaceae bacterium]|nr:DUF1461 domain-containing protein [Candidatus Polarisedimenticolaceae bacterium]